MKLPERQHAIVPEAKITEYLLSETHRAGRTKAAFFKRFGFTHEQWQVIADALLQHARDHAVTRTEASDFGIRYIIEGSLMTPNGRNPIIRSVWFVEHGESVPRFATAYPVKERRP